MSSTIRVVPIEQAILSILLRNPNKIYEIDSSLFISKIAFAIFEGIKVLFNSNTSINPKNIMLEVVKTEVFNEKQAEA